MKKVIIATPNLSAALSTPMLNNGLHGIHGDVHRIINKISKTLSEVQLSEGGKPARYYNAYKLFTIHKGIAVLESIGTQTTNEEREVIGILLNRLRAMLED